MLNLDRSAPREEIAARAREFFEGIAAARADYRFWVRLEDCDVDGDASWVPELLRRGAPHEEEFTFLGNLNDSGDLVVDVGANWGYSAASIWASGFSGKVFSLEPVTQFRDALQAVKEARAGRYDYRITGLGATPGKQSLYCPVVNGRAITACLSDRVDAEGWAQGALATVSSETRKEGDTTEDRIDVALLESPIATLDSIFFDGRPCDLAFSRIAAIKIDVNGAEHDVIAGAQRVIRTHRPILLVSGVSADHRIDDLMLSLDYVSADYENGKLVCTPFLPGRYNSFYVPAEHVKMLEARGLLTARDEREPFKCRSCGGKSEALVLRDVASNMVRCWDCSIVCYWPLPTEGYLRDWYSSHEGYVPLIRRVLDRYLADPGPFEEAARYIAGVAEEHLRRPLRKILDVGCAYGYQLIELKGLGYECFGIEASRETSAYARDQGVNVHTGTLSDAPFAEGSFDLIYMSHSLEHMTDPVAALHAAHKMLARGGVIWIKVPNWGSLGARARGYHWIWRNWPEHLFYFTPETLSQLLHKVGLQIARVWTEETGDAADQLQDVLGAAGLSPQLVMSDMAKVSRLLAGSGLGQEVDIIGIRRT